MFEIDLKRSSPRTPSLELPEQEARSAWAPLLPIAGVLALLGALLFVANVVFDRRLSARREEVVALEARVNGQRQELADLSGKRRALYGMQQQDVYWSDVLRLFSEKTPDKLWITQVKIVTSAGEKGAPVTRTLALEGGVLSARSEGNLDLIGRYVQTLESDPRYKENFGAATLESVTRASGDPLALVFQIRSPLAVR